MSSVCDWGKGSIVLANRELVEAVVASLRPSDAKEVLDLGGIDPKAHIAGSWDSYNLSLVGLIGQEPVCFIGVKEDPDSFGLSARVFCAFTDEAVKHKLTVGIISRRCIILLSSLYERLHNIKPEYQTEHIKWLKSLGFEFFETGYKTKSGAQILYFQKLKHKNNI